LPPGKGVPSGALVWTTSHAPRREARRTSRIRSGASGHTPPSRPGDHRACAEEQHRFPRI